MKNIFFIILVVSIASCANKERPNSGMQRVLSDINNSDKSYAIIPLPDSLEQYKKGQFQMNSKTKIYTSVETISEAYYLLSFIKGKPNNIRYRLENYSNKVGNYGIYLSIDKNLRHEEGYTIKISQNAIKITGKNNHGVFYGIQTLRQLMPDIAEEDNSGSENKLISYVKSGVLGNNMTVPYCEIYDYPRYHFRGMELDVSRHFLSVESIKKYVDILAMHKINFFVWHLSDDQGWRIDIKSFPQLTEIGARRTETMIDKNFDPYKSDNKEYYHFYTQEEIREVVEYAFARHVEIIPDISFPGHASAILAAYPGLGGNKEYSVATSWGEFGNYVYPTSQAITFIKSVLLEFKLLFPSKYIKLSGISKGDLVINDIELRKLGFADELDLNRFFINNLKPWLNANGKIMILPYSLLDDEKSKKAEEGCDGFYTDSDQVLLGNTDAFQFAQYPTRIKGDKTFLGGYLNYKGVYDIEKMLPEIDEKSMIYGGIANLTTEYVNNMDEAEYLLLPRLAAFSEVFWTNKDSLPGLWPRNQNLYGKYKARSYNYSN